MSIVSKWDFRLSICISRDGGEALDGMGLQVDVRSVHTVEPVKWYSKAAGMNVALNAMVGILGKCRGSSCNWR